MSGDEHKWRAAAAAGSVAKPPIETGAPEPAAPGDSAAVTKRTIAAATAAEAEPAPESPFAAFHEAEPSGPHAVVAPVRDPGTDGAEGAGGGGDAGSPPAMADAAAPVAAPSDDEPLFSMPVADAPAAAAGHAGAPSALTSWARGAGRMAMAGASVGLGVALLALRGDFSGFLRDNHIGAGARAFVLKSIVAFVALLVTVPTAILLLRRRSLGGLGAAAARLDTVGQRLGPVALVVFVPLLFHWKVWSDHEITFLVLVWLLSLAAERTLRVALVAPPLWGAFQPGGALGRPSSRAARAGGRVLAALGRTPAAIARLGVRLRGLTVPLVVLGSAGYATFFSFFTIRYHRNLHTTSFDLGLEENLVWNILHGFHFFKSTPFSGPSGTHFGNHATFIAYLLAPFYAIYQHGETMLVIQAVLMGAAAIPLYFFARRHLGHWAGCLVAFTYLLYPPLHGAALYDFHYLPLGPVFLWSCLYFVEQRRNRWAIVFAILTLSVREDVAAGLGIVGGYLLLSGERPRVGLVLAALGTATFVVLKLVVMPHFAGGDSFVYMYQGLLPSGETTFGGVLKTVVSNPAFTLGTLLERDKVLYILQLFVPLAFLPLRRPLGILFVSAGFIFTLLSTGYAPLIQTSFQYTTHWTSYLFIGLVVTLAGLRRSPDRGAGPGRVRFAAALAGLACGIVACTYQFGAVLQQHTVRGGFGLYDFESSPEETRQRQDLYELIAMIPRKASVASSENIVPQVSNRLNAYTLRTGNHDAEYLLFTVPIRGDERPHVYEPIRDHRYGVVAVRNNFALAKRGHPDTLNATLLYRM